jgi:hypothetical protein
MVKRLLGAFVLLSIWVNTASAQQFPPGLVDPSPNSRGDGCSALGLG